MPPPNAGFGRADPDGRRASTAIGQDGEVRADLRHPGRVDRRRSARVSAASASASTSPNGPMTALSPA